MDAGIGAVTGLAWVETNIVDTERAAFIAAHPDTAGGVVVTDPARFDAAVAALTDLLVAPRSPVTMTAAPGNGSSGTREHLHVVVPHRATWDRAWAAQAQAELEARIDGRRDTIRAAEDAAERHRDLAAGIRAFTQRWAGTDADALRAAAAADADAVNSSAARLAELDHRIAAVDAERDGARSARGTAQLALADAKASRATVERLAVVVDAAADAARRLSEVPAERTARRVARDTAAGAAEAARTAATDASNRAISRAKDAARWRDDLADVAGYDDGVDPGGNLDTARQTWQSLTVRLRDATTGSSQRQALDAAQEELAHADRRLGLHTPAAQQRAGELADTLDAAAADTLRAAVTAAAGRRVAAETRVARANAAVDAAAVELRVAEPGPGRANWIELANVAEWQPEHPDQVPSLLVALDRHAEEVRRALRVAEDELHEFESLRNEITADNESMADTAKMWNLRSADPVVVEAYSGTREEARTAMRGLLDNRTSANDDHATTTAALSEAVRRLRAVTTRGEWRELQHPLALRIRDFDDDQLLADAATLSKEATVLAVSCRGDLAGLNENRTMLRDELLGLCRAQRRLLKSVTTASQLPAGLGAVSHQAALRIGFEVARDEEAAGALAVRIDTWAAELAQNKRRTSGHAARVRLLADAVSDTVRNRPRAGRFTVEVLKPRLDSAVTYCAPGRIPAEFSGGQVLTLAVLVFCALSKVRSQNRTGGSRPPGALILDNPFGRASAEALVAMQHRLAAHSGVQLICATGIQDPGVDAAFTAPGSVVARLRNDGDIRRNLSYLRVRSVSTSGVEQALAGGRDPGDPANYVTATTYRVRT